MIRAAALPLLALVVTSACSSSGDAPARQAVLPSAPATPAPAPSFPAGTSPAGGVAYRFALPEAPAYEGGSAEQRENGVVVRRWHHTPVAGGPSCTIVASEQTAYTGNFPAANLQVFAALSAEDRVLHNDVADPPAGGVGAVRQESVFTATLPDGRNVPSHLYQRQVLTAGRTLVQLTAAGAETDASACGLQAVVASLQLTGQEAAGAPPASSPAPGAS